MHLPDGILPLTQSILYWLLSLIVIIISFYYFSQEKQKEKQIVAIAVYSVFTTVTSSLSIPSPLGVPIHFFTIPLLVFLLGYCKANIVCSISLFAQALLLGMGGITSFGANFLIIGFIITSTVYLVYNLFSKIQETYALFISTVCGIMFATLGQVIVLLLSGTMTLYTLLSVLVPFYLFISIIEAFLTIIVIDLVKSVKPELLKNGILGDYE